MSPPPQRLGFAPAPIILDLKEIVDLFRALIERDDKQTELARSRLNQYASSPVQLNSASVTKEDLSELLSQSALIPEQYLSLVLNLLLFRNEPEIVDFGADKLKTESDRAAFYADLFFRRSSREARHTNISTYSKHTELLLELCKDSENPQAISAALLLLKLDLNQFLEPVLKQACTWQRNSKRYLLDALAGAQLSSQISKENSLALEQMLVSAVDELMTRTHLPRQETYWYENIALLIYFLDSGDAKLHCSRQLLLLNGPFPNLWQHRNYLNVLAHTVDDPESVWKLLCRAFPEYDS